MKIIRKSSNERIPVKQIQIGECFIYQSESLESSAEYLYLKIVKNTRHPDSSVSCLCLQSAFTPPYSVSWFDETELIYPIKMQLVEVD
jgi:hypothetical protein